MFTINAKSQICCQIDLIKILLTFANFFLNSNSNTLQQIFFILVTCCKFEHKLEMFIYSYHKFLYKISFYIFFNLALILSKNSDFYKLEIFSKNILYEN